MKRLLLILCLCVPLFAQEPAAQKEAAAGEHQTEQHKDMTPWLWANFLILMGAVGYLAKKHGGPYLAARSESIRQGITEAEKQKAAADARVAEVNVKLARLDADIAALRTTLREEQEGEAERVRAQNAAELERIQVNAEQQMEAAVKAARVELRQFSGKLALDLAERKIRARITPETQQQLARDFVDHLS